MCSLCSCLQVAGDPKRATTPHPLGMTVAAASPVESAAWWWAKHPAARLACAVFVLLAILFVYYGDPASYSGSLSYGTLVGDIYHGFFQVP